MLAISTPLSPFPSVTSQVTLEYLAQFDLNV